MRKLGKRVIVTAMSVAVVLSMMVPALAAITDFDSITALEKDFSQAAQLPLTGYYTKNIGEGRTVKVYIAEEASIRTYATIVAVPDGVDTQKFLDAQGWLAVADEKGEALYVLEPGANGWGTPEEESDYVKAAIGFLRSGKNGNDQVVFSTFGEFYVVGYGKGAAPLEAWAAANPILVISQAYVYGASAGSDTLTKAGEPMYDGMNTSGYDPGISDAALFQSELNKIGAVQIAKKDIPVPTWIVGRDAADSVAYWKKANDCADDAQNGIYYQFRDSRALQTNYANTYMLGSSAHGISQVKTSTGDPKAAEIYKWLSTWTRYDVTFAYSNGLFPRLDYTAARVAAQKAAKGGAVASTLSDGTQILAQSDVTLPGHGTVQVGVIQFSDNNGDGKWDPREYIIYIPEGHAGKNLPIMMVYPGNTQTDSIFMDSTLWWDVAEKEGFALAIICETYSANPCSVSHADSDLFYKSLISVLKETVNGKMANLDFSRIYCTGQSAGSMATQEFAMTAPEFFAAVGSTSGIIRPSDNKWPEKMSGNPIPNTLIIGQSDLPNLMPALWSNETSQKWFEYMCKVNNMADAEMGTADCAHEFLYHRTDMYNWKNADGIPVVQYGFTHLRAHNCYPSEMPVVWDFVKHFSFKTAEDGTITRYYSASAFEKDDAVVLK